MKEATSETTKIRTANQAYAYVRDMAKLENETLKALYLNGRYELVHEEVVAIGSLTNATVSPRDVYRPAISHHAAAVIVVHNHVSGTLEPTSADLELTAQLFRAGQILGIELLDHLIITEDTYLSVVGEKYQEGQA